jgi:hypothetical protein
MKTLKFFTPIIWIIVLMYLLSYAIDMLNTASTLENNLGLLYIILMLYISVKLRLGLKLFKIKLTIKTKNNEKI